MLRIRVIPIVLIDGFSVLKTIEFNTRRNLGNPIAVARIYNSRNVDELVLLDIDASKQNRSIDMFTIKEVAAECFMPLTVGGGIKTVLDIKKLLQSGADKVSINTTALNDPDFIRESAAMFGSQCIVVSIDYIKDNGHYKIYKTGGDILDRDPLKWCRTAEKMGAGELLINSVDHDGNQAGCDLTFIKAVSEKVNIPVISAGGIGSTDDAVKTIKAGASAVAASSIFHFSSITPNDCKNSLGQAGFPVRDL
jgi:cyclase